MKYLKLYDAYVYKRCTHEQALAIHNQIEQLLDVEMEVMSSPYFIQKKYGTPSIGYGHGTELKFIYGYQLDQELLPMFTKVVNKFSKKHSIETSIYTETVDEWTTIWLTVVVDSQDYLK